MKEDKIEQLLEAIEHPEAYSDEALEKLFADEEVREYYELYVSCQQTKGSKRAVSQAETVCFSGRNNSFLLKKLSIAAIVLFAIILSGISYAMIFSKKSPVAETEKAAISSKTAPAVLSSVFTKDTTLTFQDTELNTILETVAPHYQVGVEYRNEHIRHIRLYTKWHTTEPLEQMVERLNGFEKVNITIDHNLLIAE